MSNLARKEETAFAITTTVPGFMEAAEIISKLREKYAGKTYDVSTTSGMKEAIEARRELREARIALDKRKPEVKREALDFCAKVESDYKAIRAAVSEYEDIPDAIIKAAEEAKKEADRIKAEAEKNRIAAIQDNIQKIRNIPLNQQGKSSADINGVLVRAKSITIGDQYAEFQAEAEAARQNCIIALEKLLTDTVAHEEEQKRIAAERAELAKLRAEAEERDRQAKAELEVQEARLAAERKKIEDERAAEEKRVADARAEEEKKAQAIRDEEAAKLAAEREAHEAKMKTEQAEADRIRREQEESANLMALQQAALDQQKKDLEEAEKARLARLTTCPKCGHEWEVQS
jgi:hypothetical protein